MPLEKLGFGKEAIRYPQPGSRTIQTQQAHPLSEHTPEEERVADEIAFPETSRFEEEGQVMRRRLNVPRRRRVFPFPPPLEPPPTPWLNRPLTFEDQLLCNEIGEAGISKKVTPP